MRDYERQLIEGLPKEEGEKLLATTRKISKVARKLSKGVRSINRCGACKTKLERAVNPMIGHHFLNCFKCFPYYTRARK